VTRSSFRTILQYSVEFMEGVEFLYVIKYQQYLNINIHTQNSVKSSPDT